MDEAIRAAIRMGDNDTAVKLILSAATDSRASVGLGPESDLTPLQAAVRYDSRAAELLIEAGAPWDLYSAAASGNLDQIERLANPQSLAAEVEGMTPLGVAILQGQQDAVRRLLELGDDPQRNQSRAGFFVWETSALEVGPVSWHPLHLASLHGYLETAADTIGLLIDHEGDSTASSPLGCNCLHLSAIYSWLPVSEVLLSRGVDVNAATLPVADHIWRMSSPEHVAPAYARTPLMISVSEGQESAVRFFLARGADVDARDSNGATALHLAARPWWREDADIVGILLEHGADETQVDQQGRTPIDMARDAGFAETLTRFTQ